MSTDTLNETEKNVQRAILSYGSSIDSSTIEPEGAFADYIRIFSYADSIDWTLNTIALCCSIAAGTSLPLMTIVFGKFVSTFNYFAIGELSAQAFRLRIDSFTLWFVYLFIGKLFLTYVYTLAITISATRTTKALRIDFLERVLRQEISFFDTTSTESVSAQVTTSVNLISNGIGEKLGIAVVAIATFISAFAVALTVQWRLTLITMVIIPLLVIGSGATVWIDAKQEARILRHFSKAASLAEEVFSSIHTVHAFSAHEKLSRRFDKFLKAAEDEGKRKSLNLGVMYCIEYFCMFAGYALAFWQGIRMYNLGHIQDPGKVITVVLAVVMAATSINYVAPQLTVISKAMSAASELFRIIDRPSLIDPLAKSGIQPLKVTGEIEFRDVKFSYPSRPSAGVIKGLTLSIPAKKTTALVGASGCGKSTIIGLLERWYDPSSGIILLDGVEISLLNLHWLRTNLRSVQQLPTLFTGTVFQNVVNGLVGTESVNVPREVQLALVEEACKSANAHEFIMQLPLGYNTEVGEHGTMLSGGQKQRIAIARSIVSNPKVLLLDEATSALDAQSEKVVQSALDRVSQNRTTIVIAHKLATIQNADNIAVMAEGTIVEQGTHEELLAAKGIYSRMAASQDLGQEDEVPPLPFPQSLLEEATSTLKEKVPLDENVIVKPDKIKETMNYSLIKCLRMIIQEQKSLWLCFVVLFSACTIAGMTFPVQAFIFAQAMEVFQLEGDEQRRKGDHFSVMFFIVAVLNLAVYFVIGWVSNLVAQTATHSYRLEMFQNILSQDVAFFSRSENTAGALTSHLSNEPTSLEDLFGFNLIIIMIAVMNIIGSCILALIFGWKLSLVVIFGALTFLIFSGFVRIHMGTKLEDFTSKHFSQSAGLAGEAVAAIRTVSSLALESHIIARYRASLEYVVQKSIKESVFTMLWFSLSQSIEFLALALGFWYGGHLLSTHEYSTRQFYTVFTAVIFTGQAAAQFFSFTTSIAKATSSANYIFWLRNQKPTIRETSLNRTESPTGNGQIDLCDLKFSYPQRHSEVIRGIDLTIQPGQLAAFVGPSGCGKSTLIALLERFYDPTSGQINISNRNLCRLSPRLYRATVGLVQQEPILYQGSIRENIALGQDSPATDEQIFRACAQANILTFIQSLPEGFSTPCGAQGLQLSGGQRQRITIARALIRKPNLLLLDEATSALDRESEKLVQEALERAGQHTTTIAVAHRLSTIKDADVICVIDNGKIVEAGTHRTLLTQRGVYYKMCLAQSLNKD